MIRRSTFVAASLGILLTLAQPAAAQTFGIGPRLSFVRGDLTTGTPSSRFTGATMRLQTSRHVGIELAVDYKTTVNQDGTAACASCRCKARCCSSSDATRSHRTARRVWLTRRRLMSKTRPACM
jgi:hypothetical protein